MLAQVCDIVSIFAVQKAFGIDLFPDSVFELEGKYYLSKMNEVRKILVYSCHGTNCLHDEGSSSWGHNPILVAMHTAGQHIHIVFNIICLHKSSTAFTLVGFASKHLSHSHNPMIFVCCLRTLYKHLITEIFLYPWKPYNNG